MHLLIDDPSSGEARIKNSSLHSEMLIQISRVLRSGKTVRKFVQQPPRHINEARLTTVDRKICSLNWDGRSQLSLTLQDRASSLTYPISLRRDAGKFQSCYRDGGMISLKSTSETPVELLVGADRGVLYFSITSFVTRSRAAFTVPLSK